MQDSNITQVTHVYNAMSKFHHRNLNILTEALTNDNITTELLADEATVHPSVMSMLMKLKPKDKIVLISDALPYAGKNENFVMGRKKIYVDKNGIPRDDKGTLAGNMKFLHNTAKTLIQDTIMTFADFIKYACINPARNNGALDDFTVKKDLTPNFSVWNNKTNTIEKTFIA
jgi:N-acetylglucosamine-6-phosphate deacetylase